MLKKISTLFLLMLLFSCVKEDVPSVDPNICNIDMENFDFNFGIDYTNPEQYLIPGEQSNISESLFLEIKDSIGVVPENLYGVLKICQWINFNFNKFNSIYQYFICGIIYTKSIATFYFSIASTVNNII
jgi:hypothetical protein